MILNYYNDLVYQPSELFLHKDFGQVATVLGALHGMSVTHLICCNDCNEDLVTFLAADVVQVKKRFQWLPSKLDFLKNLSAYRFLFEHRNEFSCLVMFPFCPPSDLLIAKLFSAFNPSARIILKLDGNVDYLKNLQTSYDAAPNSRVRQHYYYRRLLDIADAVIYETRNVGQLLTRKGFLGLAPSAKYVNIFNGISDNYVRKVVDPCLIPVHREQVIIFSGRLSSPQKNVDLIFRSDPVPEGWRIKFIGRIDEDFRKLIDGYRQNDKNFDRKYEFIGEVTDKSKYFQEFCRGRVLLLSSIWEGFPMVYAEAHYFGLHIITTDVSGAEEATHGGRVGTIIPSNDPNALRVAMHHVCSSMVFEQPNELGREYGANHFIWEHSLRNPIIDSLFASQVPEVLN